ncbi:MAG: hypothetical protein DHS20C21_18060 [Gemmatimonadota bacterium]|nr:MAG: hypothetical protein DHS20C21_18060 [Gemmatimonadota bacterium]
MRSLDEVISDCTLRLAKARSALEEAEALVEERAKEVEFRDRMLRELEAQVSKAGTAAVSMENLPMSNGKPVRWAVIKVACDHLPGDVVAMSDVVEKAEELFPDYDVRPRYLSRDMTRRSELWEPTGKRGLWRCRWKADGQRSEESQLAQALDSLLRKKKGASEL